MRFCEAGNESVFKRTAVQPTEKKPKNGMANEKKRGNKQDDDDEYKKLGPVST